MNYSPHFLGAIAELEHLDQGFRENIFGIVTGFISIRKVYDYIRILKYMIRMRIEMNEDSYYHDLNGYLQIEGKHSV